MIVDPWGTVLACRPKEPGVVLAEVSATHLATVRRNMPCLSHRRL